MVVSVCKTVRQIWVNVELCGLLDKCCSQCLEPGQCGNAGKQGSHCQQASRALTVSRQAGLSLSAGKLACSLQGSQVAETRHAVPEPDAPAGGHLPTPRRFKTRLQAG